MATVVGQMVSILGMQRISLQNSLGAVLLDLDQQQLVDPRGSNQMEGRLVHLAVLIIFSELIARELH